MKLKVKDLENIICNVKNDINYQNITPCLKNILDNCYYSKNLFYTIEYVDIIINDDKVDNYLSEDLKQNLQKMLLYILKNKSVKFDKKYFDILIELAKIDNMLEYDISSGRFEMNSDDSSKISAREYNKLLFILSIDYTHYYIKECDDDLFIKTLDTTFNDVFTNLIDTYSYYKESKELFIKLTRYSPIIANVILNNGEYIDDLQERKLKEGINGNDYMFILEYNLFIALVGIFISRTNDFHCDYSLISKTINKVMTYIKEDYIHKLDNFVITNDDFLYLQQCMVDILYGLNTSKKKIN